MKLLVALTCVAIISAITYLAWGEYNAMLAGQADAHAEAYRQGCLNLLDQMRDLSPETEQRLDDCIASKIVTQLEVSDALARSMGY